MDTSLETFLSEYTRCTNTHQFDVVAPLIAEDAIYFFSDGSYRGLASIRLAFERTWSIIQDEYYAIEDVEWLTLDTSSATCIYTFHWRGSIDGVLREGSGRGTTVLRQGHDHWQVVHEHLSSLPA
jgi:ketosteroid isomerase-like protein